MMHMTIAMKGGLDIPSFTKAFAAKRKDFYGTAMKMVVEDIVTGILAQRAATGGRFPTLADSTIARKGHDRSLIDKGLLSDPYTYEQLNRWREDMGIISVKPLSAAAGSKWGLLNRAISGTAAKEKKGGGFSRPRAPKAPRATPPATWSPATCRSTA